MLITIQKSLLTCFLSTGLCYAASRPELYSHIFYTPTPHTMAAYIATYGDATSFEPIAEQLFTDIAKAPLDLQHTKETVYTACAKTAKDTFYKFCHIELFTDKHHIRSTYDTTRQFNDYDPFDPYEWTVMLVYPDRKNELALFLDCRKLQPTPAEAENTD